MLSRLKLYLGGYLLADKFMRLWVEESIKNLRLRSALRAERERAAWREEKIREGMKR